MLRLRTRGGGHVPDHCRISRADFACFCAGCDTRRKLAGAACARIFQTQRLRHSYKTLCRMDDRLLLVNDSGMNLYMGLHHPKRLLDGGPLAGAPHGAGQAETVGRDPNAFKRDGGATGVSVGKEAGTPASTGAVFRRAAV